MFVCADIRSDPRQMAREAREDPPGGGGRVAGGAWHEPRGHPAATEGGQHRHSLSGHHQVRRAPVGGSHAQHPRHQKAHRTLPQD